MNHDAPSPAASANAPASSATSSAAAKAETKGLAPVHDFAAKLRQGALWPHVVDYVAWQQARRRAAAAGHAEPELPALVPLSINLDLTTACNYACDHCIDWDILNSKVRHEDESLRESLRAMAARGLRSVILIGGGEPTLYPGFPDMVAFLKALGLQVAIVSNGSRGDRLLQAAGHMGKGDWIRLSLDAGSNDVFRRMHNPSSKTLTLDEICSWIPRIRAAQPELTVGFSFVITWQGGSRGAVKVIENIHEMVLAAERARSAGFHYISFKPFLERTADGSEVMDPAHAADLGAAIEAIQRNVALARQLERPDFRVIESTNLRVLVAGNWRDYTRQPKVCHMQALRQVVTPLGTFNCPAHRGVEKARVGAKDAWADPAAATARTRDILDRFDASSECREVTCLYHGTNWWIESLIEASVAPVAPVDGPPGSDFFL